MPSRLLAPTCALPLGLPLALVLGCGGDHLTQPKPVDTNELYWALELNHHAVTLATHAPYDTLPLAAVARTPTGAALPSSATPSYLSRDITRIVVTPEGVLHAIGVTADPVWVIATLTASGVTRADSVRVRAVDVTEPPVLMAFSIQPIAPDSAKVAAGWPAPPLPVHATDSDGASMTDLMVAFRGSDELLLRVEPLTGSLLGVRPGRVTVSASAMVFGVARADSVLYRVGAPILASLDFAWPVPEPGVIPEFRTVTVGVGALVMWFPTGVNSPDLPAFSLAFDSAVLPNVAPATAFTVFNIVPRCAAYGADCSAAGNISVVPPDTRTAFRVFTAPGTYDYWCAPCGSGGRVVVLDESEP